MRPARIAVFSGSVRTQSVNTKLAQHVAGLLAEADAQVSLLTLGDYPMPIYDGDEEKKSGAPQTVNALRQVLMDHDGVFIACPEYNCAPPPLLKNVLDWLSRTPDGERLEENLFKGRIFALGAATPGQLGGIRALIALRTILEVGLGATVIPEMATLPDAFNAFDENGAIAQPRAAGMAKAAVTRLMREVRLSGHV